METFQRTYAALSGGLTPFPWQEELFARLCRADIPSNAVLPTGCGKTATMLVWLLALAWQARNGAAGVGLPRHQQPADLGSREAAASLKLLGQPCDWRWGMTFPRRDTSC